MPIDDRAEMIELAQQMMVLLIEDNFTELKTILEIENPGLREDRLEEFIVELGLDKDVIKKPLLKCPWGKGVYWKAAAEGGPIHTD